jgi:hypothetical protein
VRDTDPIESTGKRFPEHHGVPKKPGVSFLKTDKAKYGSTALPKDAVDLLQ